MVLADAAEKQTMCALAGGSDDILRCRGETLISSGSVEDSMLPFLLREARARATAAAPAPELPLTDDGSGKLQRVLVFSIVYPPLVGGIERLLSGLVAQLRAVDVTVIAPYVEEALAFDSVQPYVVERVRARDSKQVMPGRDDRRLVLPMIRRGIAVGLRSRPDVLVIGHAGILLFVGWIVAVVLRRPYVVWVMGTEMLRAQRSRRRILHNAILSRAARVIGISEYSCRLALDAGIRPHRVAKILPPVDHCRFRPGAQATARARLGLPDRPTLLSVSRIRYYKGHDVVIRALPSVSVHFPDILYLIAGSGPDTPRLEELTSRLGVQAQVRFLGTVPDDELPDLYRSADIFVLPSRESEEHGDVEGFGIVYVEAGACGIPVVGGQSGGIGDAVVDGVTGLLVDPESPAEVGRAITRLLRDASERARLGNAARQRVERELTLPAAARSFENVLFQSAGH